jgi:serine/threonine protein kinase
MSDRVGQQLGNYRLVHLLGRGGFAEVYLGQHLRLNMQAAIKVLHTQLAENDIESFHREAETIASLVHPHIVRILDFDVKDGVPFLVMDYAPNGSLRLRHPKNVPVPLPIILTYVKQVADALQYAHDQKLIHRDVKPENMLLGRRNEVLLSDFGIAIMAQSSSYQGTQDMAGTINYMAPEQIQAHPRSASDQYALGIVVYEWLSGERPFSGSFAEIAAKHAMMPPPSLCEKVPTISPGLEQVVLSALAKDPRQRFVNVRAFATALEQASQLARARPMPVNPTPMTTIPNQYQQPTMLATPMMDLPQQMTVSESPANASVPSHMAQTSIIVTPSALSPRSEAIPVIQGRPESTRRGISRRTVVFGLGVAGLAAVGSVAWLVLSQGQLWPLAPGRTPSPSPTPTPIPIGTMLYTYRGHSNDVQAVVWSPHSQRIASGGDDNTVQVWDAADGGHVFTYHGHSDPVHALAWSPDGRRIASAGNDKTVQVWDAADGGHVFTYHGHSDLVDAVRWSPEGSRIASGSWDRTVQVWDAANGGNEYTYRGHSDFVDAVAWSPNGRRIASGSNDGTVQVWDAADGGHIYTGQTTLDNPVAWSPNGRRIASGSNDGTVQVWDAADGGHIYTYSGHSDIVIAVAWSPDGTRIVSAGNYKTVLVWGAVS